VKIVEGSRLHGLLGLDAMTVNSMHHQGIKTLAPGLIPNAYAPDGVVEGAEAANGHFMIGVQWHPEDLTDCEPCMRRLFESFIEASMEFKQSQAMISSVV